MESNQLYILKNRSFQRNVFKIGMTKKHPGSRARQIYAGATGVPEPFEVVFACSVADCRIAERSVHRRLAAYRVNNSREFFRIPAKIARKIVLEVCTDVNTERKCERPIVTVDLIAIQELDSPTSDQYQEKYGEIFSIPIGGLERQPIGTSILSRSQKERISLISEILFEVFPDDDSIWYDDFSRDHGPETEIRIWEHIAKAFVKIDELEYLNTVEKKEAYDLLLARSLAPSKIVLKEHKLCYFTRDAALKIMAGYELSPKPITVAYIKPKIATHHRLDLKPIKSVIPEILASQRKS